MNKCCDSDGDGIGEINMNALLIYGDRQASLARNYFELSYFSPAVQPSLFLAYLPSPGQIPVLAPPPGGGAGAGTGGGKGRDARFQSLSS